LERERERDIHIILPEESDPLFLCVSLIS